MRLLRCRKCGTFITTQDTMVENMMEEINRLNRLAEKAARGKDKSLINVYQQQSAQVSKLMKQILHLTAQKDAAYRVEKQEKSVLVHYLLTNNLITHEKLNELNEIARIKVEEKNKADQAEIERLYGDFESTLTNRTKNDPTAKAAMKKKV